LPSWQARSTTRGTWPLLDTKDEGAYLYSKGAISLIAKSGTGIAGVGTIYDLEEGNAITAGLPATPTGDPAPFMLLNNAGQVAFPATLKDARIGLLLATPRP